jgi:hypothetical protein
MIAILTPWPEFPPVACHALAALIKGALVELSM